MSSKLVDTSRENKPESVTPELSPGDPVSVAILFLGMLSVTEPATEGTVSISRVTVFVRVANGVSSSGVSATNSMESWDALCVDGDRLLPELEMLSMSSGVGRGGSWGGCGSKIIGGESLRGCLREPACSPEEQIIQL